MDSNSSGSLQVHRENMKPKKSAWLVGSKDNYIDRKKEPWNGLKPYHERKNQEASRSREITEDSLVHSTGYAIVVELRDWASVIDGDELLPSSGSTSLVKT